MPDSISVSEVVQRNTLAPSERIRDYTADGTLYAYRDGDTHVVVGKTRDRRDEWATRVPAERRAVLKGERLWTIPDNWEMKLKHDHGDRPTQETYRIDGARLYATVERPQNNYLTDAWYRVLAVGPLRVDVDAYDASNVSDAIRRAEQDGVPDDVLACLRDLKDRFDYLAAMADEWITEDAERLTREDMDGQRAGGSLVCDGEYYEPWRDYADWHWFIEQATADDHTDEVCREAATVLTDEGALARLPDVRVTVDTDARPEDTDLRACMEAGCSPAVAVDYLACESYGYSQGEWADLRGVDQSTVSGNVREGRVVLR